MASSSNCHIAKSLGLIALGAGLVLGLGMLGSAGTAKTYPYWGRPAEIYLAAPLFSDAERAYNVEIAELLRSTGARVFLPQESESNLAARDGKRTPRAIFDSDLAALQRAELVVAVIDGADVDSGTAWEMGYASALGKPVVALRTDFRRVGDAALVNLMLEESTTVVTSREALLTVVAGVRNKNIS